AAGSYVRWAAEYRESHELSDERAAQLEQEEREREEQKQEQEARERELLLEGEKPTTPRDVAQWLYDTQPPPYTGESPTIPSHMMHPGPSREAEIVIEELPGASFGGGY